MSRRMIEKMYRIARRNPELYYHADRIASYLEGGNSFRGRRASSRGGRRRYAGFHKQAVSKSTEDLIKWALLRDEAISKGEAIDFFRSNLDREPYDPSQRRGPNLRWRVGDRVQIDASSCKDELILPVISDFDGEMGTVMETEEESRELIPDIPSSTAKSYKRSYGHIMIKLDSGPTLRIPRGQKFRNSGLVRPEDTGGGGGPLVEVVYSRIPGRIPTEEAIAVAEEYISKGAPGDFRSLQYYSGNLLSLAYNKKDGTLYFRLKAQQRGFDQRTFNVEKGKVLYLGLMSKRPSGIDRELEKLLAAGRRM